MKKRFSLSVTDFAIASPLQGSIDTHSGYTHGSEMGVLLHKEIQARREKEFSSYLSEVSVKHEFKYKNYIFEVKGRIDGMYRVDKTFLEEIKSAFNLKKLHTYINNEIESHPYCLQLLTYGYMHWLKNNEIPALNLHLVSSRNKKSIDLSLELNIDHYQAWLERRLAELVKQIKQTEKRIKERQKIAKDLDFPFAKPRHGQIELVAALQNSFTKNQPILLQAPTGLGKTIGVLYPALQDAMSRGQKVIYVTPKNSQHTVAQDAVKKLQMKHSNNSMTLTAKGKLCFKSQTICNSEFCEFAKDYYTKLTENKIVDKLNKIKNLTSTHFKQIGLDYEVCPFELQMETVANRDTIICDYNYVFSPQAVANRLGKTFLGETEKPNLIIDEFHNLPERAMGYYSPILSALTLKNWMLAINNVNEKFREKILTLLAECTKLIEDSANPTIQVPHKINPPIQSFKEIETKLREFLVEYLESDVEIGRDDIVLNLFNYWIDFTSALEFVEERSGEFFTSYYPKDVAIKITCCDASVMLQSCYDPYTQIVGFSATLKPFKYYSELTGLNNKNLNTIEFLSPFPKSNRKLLVIPQVSSKYTDRSRNYPRIAEAIKKISHLRQGNYFVFFPSFDFLEKVLKLYPQSDDFKIISQKRNMTFQDIENILIELKDTSTHHLIFAIQGGILAEGVDYPGDMIIGAIIVGVPLPMYDWEREQMKHYYEEKYQAGVDYAYIYPAMAKSIQSSGRVIRSEGDKGIIVLMDPRFLQESYAKCMPHDWFAETPLELISNTILSDINGFGKNLKVSVTLKLCEICYNISIITLILLKGIYELSGYIFMAKIPQSQYLYFYL